jgi:predicted transcriptional regulator
MSDLAAALDALAGASDEDHDRLFVRALRLLIARAAISHATGFVHRGGSTGRTRAA